LREAKRALTIAAYLLRKPFVGEPPVSRLPRNLALSAAALIALAGAAAAQDVQSGIAAWQAGDYARAVTEWRPLAEAGNADAQFNLAQAYRLGRGVPQNLGLAEQWFERAARQRHEQAGASLGLLLFQNGRAREAMPWIQAAALRGDPRAQYVFGTALFNGDMLRRDLPRAYAMMSAAAAQGFPQAQAQLSEMERQLSAEDRDRGRQLALEMTSPPPQVASVPPQALPPVPTTPSPSSRPGVSYAPPPETEAPPAERPRVVQTVPVPRPPAVQPRTERPERPAPAPAPTPAPAAAGSWRVQLGAFSSQANARRQWEIVRRRVSALGPLSPAYSSAGALTRLRAGPLASRAGAERVCAAVRAAGEDCLIIP
jgi:cell division septation protein DedD